MKQTGILLSALVTCLQAALSPLAQQQIREQSRAPLIIPSERAYTRIEAREYRPRRSQGGYIEGSRRLGPLMDSAKAKTNSAPVNIINDSPLRGEGVLVGVIDGGFDYTHPAFRDSSGAARIFAVWDQNDSGGTPPAPYEIGSEYRRDDLDKIQHSTGTEGSHGSHVAGIIGGSAVDTTLSGLAPECTFVFVSTTFWEKDIADGVRYIFDLADSLDMPAVVNLSLGSSTGPHDGSSYIERTYEELTGPGRIIVTAGGNSGDKNQHVEKVFGPGDSLKTFIDIPWKDKHIDFWFDDPQNLRMELAAFSLSDSSHTPLWSGSFPDTVSDTAVLMPGCTLTILGNSEEINPHNGKANILFTVKNNRSDLYKKFALDFAVHADGGQLHGWNSSYSNFQSFNRPGYTAGDTNYTIIDGGGCSRGALTVGAFTSRGVFHNIFDSLVTDVHSPTPRLNQKSFFSSIGPTIDQRQKPEITAPGRTLISAYNSFAETDTTRIAYQRTTDTRTYSWGSMSGTSMATPYTTGTVALLLQLKPELTLDTLRRALQESALSDEITGPFTSNSYTSWGYGKLNVGGALQYIFNSTPLLNTLSHENSSSGIIHRDRRIHITDGGTRSLSIYSLQGRQILHRRELRKNTILNLTHITPGI
ncbi:MAG: S8 family serine peptidase, partial [Fibrobacterota bacterium]